MAEVSEEDIESVARWYCTEMKKDPDEIVTANAGSDFTDREYLEWMRTAKMQEPYIKVPAWRIYRRLAYHAMITGTLARPSSLLPKKPLGDRRRRRIVGGIVCTPIFDDEDVVVFVKSDGYPQGFHVRRFTRLVEEWCSMPFAEEES